MGIEAETLGHIATGVQSVGALTATIGSYNKAKAEKYGYEYQSKIARNNAQIKDWQADDARRRGEREEQNHRLKVAAFKGTQIANMAARGIDLGEGSALNILTDTDFMGERDALLIRDNTGKEVWGRGVEASNLRSDAAFKQMQADNISPLRSATETLLTGAGAVAKSWYAMRTRTSL